ncbi:hypothetical protein HPB50_025200 [Hyalomma asiaticum]|uniref:Uncharacterized protein n=1 Tax=Hyalomma asiaticum TaxID=266040 RepID=A0ACB7S2W0_HYAAI|nr:hypothetical protein HPB50_025200 [Hyalomma asiaticum]
MFPFKYTSTIASLQQQPVQWDPASNVGHAARVVESRQWSEADAEIGKCLHPLPGLTPVSGEAMAVDRPVARRHPIG